MFSLWSLQWFFCSLSSWFSVGERTQTVNCLSLVPHFCGRTVPLAMCMESRVMQILCMQGGDTMQRAKTDTKSCQAIASAHATHLDISLNMCCECLTKYLPHFDKVHSCFQLPRFCFWMCKQTNQTCFCYAFHCCTLHTGWMNAKEYPCRGIYTLFNKVSWTASDNNFAGKSTERNCFVCFLLFHYCTGL